MSQPLSWPPNVNELRQQRIAVMLRCRQDPSYAAVVYRRCKDDIVYFLETFGWIDQRQGVGDSAAAIPLVLYPQQKEYILHMVGILVQAAGSETFRHNELVEKARKTAGTWSTLLVFIWFWLFHNASFLIMSKKEDDVDRAGDLDTPFEKMRFFIKRLPEFLLPQGFRLYNDKGKADIRFNKTMYLGHPNGGQISGDSSAVHATRQKRALAILYDEFAYCENDEAIWTSGSGTAKVRIAVSTPNGTGNKYYRLRFGKEGEKVHITSFVWWKHPVFGRDLVQKPDGTYTSPWYEATKAAESAQTMAKEYDLNYADSIGAKIFFMYGAQHVDDQLVPTPESKIIRIWDPGLTFAILWAEIDKYERLLFYREFVCKNATLDDMAQAALEITAQMAEGCRVEDIGDPANVYRRTAITEDTEYTILQRKWGIYVRTGTISAVGPQKRTMQSIAYLKDKMSTTVNSLVPATTQLLVNPKGCPLLHEALMGAYAWQVDQNGQILEGRPAQQHPYEDVADCARYLALHAQGGMRGTGGGGPSLHVVKKQGAWSSPRSRRQQDAEWTNLNLGGGRSS